MAVHTKEDWKPWLEERRHFKNRETKGFTEDLSALQLHIKKLDEVCPKDKAGWPVGRAIEVIDKLHIEYRRFQKYIEQLR